MPPQVRPIFGPFIAVIRPIIAAINYCARAAKKRREDLAALAAELDFTFWPDRDKSHDDQYAHFEIFRCGKSRAAYNTMQGQVQIANLLCDIKMGDFRYKITHGSGKNRRTSTHRFSYAILHLPYLGVPDLLIRKEGVLDKLAGAIGFDDIDFESGEFSRRFLVTSADKRFAYDVIHPRMMEFLLQTPRLTIDIERDRCCLITGRRRWTPIEFRNIINWADSFFTLWPEHVTAELTLREEHSA